MKLSAKLAACERAWRAGVHAAVADALAWCAAHNQPPPAWTVRAVRELQALSATAKRGRGRHGNIGALRRQDIIDFMRWDCVDHLGEDRSPTTKCDLDTRCEKASELLRGSMAQGEWKAVKRSYQSVARRMRNGDGARYYAAWPDN